MLTTKEAWQEILNRVGAELVKAELSDWHDSSSINDQIQKLYREELITEPQRDEMREYVKTWLGDPNAPDPTDEMGWEDYIAYVREQPVQIYDRYACGLWAGSAGPMGDDEHAIILMTLQIMYEEAE